MLGTPGSARDGAERNDRKPIATWAALVELSLNKKIPPLDGVQMLALLHYMFTVADRRSSGVRAAQGDGLRRPHVRRRAGHATEGRRKRDPVDWAGVAQGAQRPGLATSGEAARCAGHVQQLGSESLLPNLMEVKG